MDNKLNIPDEYYNEIMALDKKFQDSGMPGFYKFMESLIGNNNQLSKIRDKPKAVKNASQKD